MKDVLILLTSINKICLSAMYIANIRFKMIKMLKIVVKLKKSIFFLPDSHKNLCKFL